MECKDLDNVMAILETINPGDKESGQALMQVKDMLMQHREGMAGEGEGEVEGVEGAEGADPMAMMKAKLDALREKPQLDTPYRSDNMKRPNPFVR